MLKRTISGICLLAALVAPAGASADTTVAADPGATQLAALDGTLVWVRGTFGSQTLMKRTPGGTVSRVPGAPAAKAYRSLDLGRDASNRLVLTYQRCSTASRCVARSDDLRGHRRSLDRLAPAGCTLSTAPAVWRSRTALGLHGRGRGPGLYVKTGGGAPKRQPLPKDAVRFGVSEITSVDVRGTRAAAVAADIYEYAFTGSRSFLAAASEGESDEHTVGLALGPGGVLWTLTDAVHTGDPNEAVISRLGPDCLQWERVKSAPNAQDFRAVDVAVDGDALYLAVPGTGIVTHEFTPEHACPAR